MIEIKNVTKRYGEKVAVDDISFNINDGEILGFLGRNGAGKTTTMNIVTGYISSSAGSVVFFIMGLTPRVRSHQSSFRSHSW